VSKREYKAYWHMKGCGTRENNIRSHSFV